MEKPSSRSAGTHLQSYGSVLMRYHSAPSSVLADLLHSEDAALLSHMEDSGLAQICMLDAPPTAQNAAEKKTVAEYAALPGHIRNCISGSILQVPNAIGSSFLQQRRDSSAAQTGGQLGPIFQQPQMISCDNLQSSAQNAQDYVVGARDHCPGFGPPIIQPFASGNGALIRQSSFPADILSRLGIEDDDEGSNQGFAENLPCHGDVLTFSRAAETMPLDNGRFAEMELEIASDNMSTAHLPLNGITDAYLACNNGSNPQISLQGAGWFEGTEPCFGKGSSFNGKNKALHANDVTMAAGHKTQSIHSASCTNQSSLFRHNSLPASLLSQLSFDGASEKLSMTSSSGNSSEDGGPHLTNQLSGLWDEAGGVTMGFGQRKRARGVEDRASNKLCTFDSIQGCPEKDILVWKIGGQEGASSSCHLSCADDSVLCKVRAKRGCATHPRSIAERVRRTKISEAMRKLQELVPNMEKQTNTATMLDEAVNYVKFLKQQVQKLSENQANCRGTCDMMNKA